MWIEVYDKLEQGLGYLLGCCVLWLVVLSALRLFVFGQSATVPVFRITPDRREARENMVTCEWIQTLINKAFDMISRDLSAGQLRRLVAENVNTFMHLSGGKFELNDLVIGSSPPQVCGVEARREGPDRVALIADLFYEGDFSASFGIEHPVQLPLLGTSMFPMQAVIESMSVQLRLHVVWDTSGHSHPAPLHDSRKHFAHPPPSTKSTLEISLANVPDISIKMHTDIGARHVIRDSQVITSLLASLAARWLGQKLIFPQKVLYRFSLPSISVPEDGAGGCGDGYDNWNATLPVAETHPHTQAYHGAQHPAPVEQRERHAAPTPQRAGRGRGEGVGKTPDRERAEGKQTPPRSPQRRGDVLEDESLDGWGERGEASASRQQHKMNILRNHAPSSFEPILAPSMPLPFSRPAGTGSAPDTDGSQGPSTPMRHLCSSPPTPVGIYPPQC